MVRRIVPSVLIVVIACDGLVVGARVSFPMDLPYPPFPSLHHHRKSFNAIVHVERKVAVDVVVASAV